MLEQLFTASGKEKGDGTERSEQLFGNVTIENLEEEPSTRNTRLMRRMEDWHIVENRGSGIKAIWQAMRTANLEPPRFNDRRTSFWVTFRNHTLMSPEAIAWLNQFANLPANDRHFHRSTLAPLGNTEIDPRIGNRELTNVEPIQPRGKDCPIECHLLFLGMMLSPNVACSGRKTFPAARAWGLQVTG
jgi:ATP-dependent DNA helicase recG-like protein